jgi:hypothetical protein
MNDVLLVEDNRIVGTVATTASLRTVERGREKRVISIL